MTRERNAARKRKERLRRKGRTELSKSFVPRFWNEIEDGSPVKKSIRRLYKRLKEDTSSDSAPRDLMCQRAAFIAVQLESMEVHAAEDGVLDVGVYTQANNCLMGMLTKLGLDRKVKRSGGLKAYLGHVG